MAYEIDERRRCIFVTLRGDVTEWDVGVGLQKLWADPTFNPQLPRLVDATEVTTASLSVTFLTALAWDFCQISTATVAFAAASEEIYELFGFYRDQLHGVQCRVFRDRAEAAEWLDISQHDASKQSTVAEH